MGKTAKATNGFRAVFKGPDVPGSNRNIGPRRCKTLGNGTPDAPAGPGDQRFFSIKRKQMR